MSSRGHQPTAPCVPTRDSGGCKGGGRGPRAPPSPTPGPAGASGSPGTPGSFILRKLHTLVWEVIAPFSGRKNKSRRRVRGRGAARGAARARPWPRGAASPHPRRRPPQPAAWARALRAVKVTRRVGTKRRGSQVPGSRLPVPPSVFLPWVCKEHVTLPGALGSCLASTAQAGAKQQ